MATYEFECELEILMIWIKLEEAWPWKWRANDGDSLGTYLSIRVQVRPDGPNVYPRRIRIVEEKPSFKIQVDMRQDMPDSILTNEQLNKIVLEKLLPAIGSAQHQGSGIDRLSRTSLCHQPLNLPQSKGSRATRSGALDHVLSASVRKDYVWSFREACARSRGHGSGEKQMKRVRHVKDSGV